MAARRWLRRGAVALSILLLLAAAAYTGYWFYAAQQIKAEIAAAAAKLKAQRLEVTWKSFRVGGYPFDFRAEMTGLRAALAEPKVELTTPRLDGTVGPFNFSRWEISIPEGFHATALKGGETIASLTATNAIGAVLSHAGGGAKIWLIVGKSTADAAANGPVSIDEVVTWLILPPEPARTGSDPDFSFAADVRGIVIPAAPPPFSTTIDDIAVGAMLLGPLPDALTAEAVDKWRRTGGTIKLDHWGLSWDNLRVSGKGSVSLDDNLQPDGSVAATIGGYDALLTAFSVAKLLPAEDLTPMKIGLAMLGPAISTYFTIKDRNMFLGPAELGKAPRIDWK